MVETLEKLISNRAHSFGFTVVLVRSTHDVWFALSHEDVMRHSRLCK